MDKQKEAKKILQSPFACIRLGMALGVGCAWGNVGLGLALGYIAGYLYYRIAIKGHDKDNNDKEQDKQK